MAEKPKELTYGQLSNIRTKLEMMNKATGNSSSKHVLPDGTKLGIKAVEKKIAALDARPGKKVNAPAKPVPVAGMKVTAKAKASTTPAAKAKPVITKAEKQIEKQLSPKGMKANEKMQGKALDKKYPGLYKKKAN